MKYLQGHFTLPTTNKRMTDEEYALAVGTFIKCERCGKIVPRAHECTPEKSHE